MKNWVDCIKFKVKRVLKCISRYRLLLIAWFSVLMIWVANWIGLVKFYDDEKGARGTFGDMFGGVNALFTGLAFATLIYTAFMQQRELRLQRMALKLQRGELKLQRIELGHTREEIRGQKEQLEQQSETFELQRFESTLFSLMQVHAMNLSNLRFDGNQGKQGVKSLWTLFFNEFRHLPELRSRDNSLLLSVQRYQSVYRDNESVFGIYFRGLYHIFKFIKSSNISNKKLYTSIIRAQLTTYEQLVLFYNCLSADGVKFKPLVEEFSLLKGLPFDKLVNPEHKSEYIEQAYG